MTYGTLGKPVFDMASINRFIKVMRRSSVVSEADRYLLRAVRRSIGTVDIGI